MRNFKVALLVFAFLFGPAVAQLIAPNPPQMKVVAVGEPAYWYLWWPKDGSGPSNHATAMAGMSIAGEPCDFNVSRDFYTIPRLKKTALLGGNVAITRCISL